MSIATKRGDGGQTSLVGGIRVSKAHPRLECYGAGCRGGAGNMRRCEESL